VTAAGRRTDRWQASGARPELTELVERARTGDARSVARLISLVEDASPLLRQVSALLGPHTGHAQVIGITGAPGVGKSTSTSALVTTLRADGHRVGVLAVDPSSPFSGGALLGDRVRMQEHATDRGVYIRTYLADERLVPRGGERYWPEPDQVEECRRRGLQAVEFVRERGYDVRGDLEDLLVPDVLEPRRSVTSVTDAEVADVAVQLVARMLEDVRELREQD